MILTNCNILAPLPPAASIVDVASVVSISLTAELITQGGGSFYANLVAVTHSSPGNNFLQVFTSTTDPRVSLVQPSDETF